MNSENPNYPYPTEREQYRIDELTELSSSAEAMVKVIGKTRYDLIGHLQRQEEREAQEIISAQGIASMREIHYNDLRQEFEKEYLSQPGMTPEAAAERAEIRVNAQRIIDQERRSNLAAPPKKY